MPYYCIKCTAAGQTCSGAPTTAFDLVITVAPVAMRDSKITQSKVIDILDQAQHTKALAAFTHTHTHRNATVKIKENERLMFESAN